MKRRPRRVVLGAAALVAGIVAVLVLANWSTVRDHVEAWHFQLTRETKTYEPITMPERGDVLFGPGPGYLLLASLTNRSVVFDPNAKGEEGGVFTIYGGSGMPIKVEHVLRAITQGDWGGGARVIDQRFPRTAYIIIRNSVTDTNPSPARP